MRAKTGNAQPRVYFILKMADATTEGSEQTDWEWVTVASRVVRRVKRASLINPSSSVCSGFVSEERFEEVTRGVKDRGARSTGSYLLWPVIAQEEAEKGEIAQTLPEAGDAEEELRYLVNVLSGR